MKKESDVRGWRLLDRVAQDLRFAWRLLVRSPAFTAVAVCTLTLAIGATTALFTIVHAVILRPLPFPAADRLVMIWEQAPDRAAPNVVSTANYLDWKARARSFAQIAALRQMAMNVLGPGGEAEQLVGLQVTSEIFPVLGVQPLIGRVIRPGEDAAGGAPTVVLSHGLWQRRFGSSPTVLGQRIAVNGEPHEIVGVMPAGFAFPGQQAELYAALQIGSPWAPARDGGRSLVTVARLREGVSVEAAAAEMEGVAAQIARERPASNARWSATVMPLLEHAVGKVRLALAVLFAAVICVLLIACVNVANLLAMRASTRAREMTVRLALGAGRWRLVQQLLVESLLLAGIGGLLGLIAARLGVPAIVSHIPASIALPRAEEIVVDRWALAWTLGVSLAAGVAFGLLPAWQAWRRNLANGLQSGSRAVTSARRMRSALVITEVTLAVVIVICAGLLSRSLLQLTRVDPGFRAERVLTLRMLLLPSKYMEPARRVAVVDRILERVSALPGVAAASSIHFLPLTGGNSGTGYYRLDRPAPPPGSSSGGEVSVVSPGYFRAMAIPLIVGRDLDARDTLDAPRVAVINQSLARRFFPGEDPIGKRLHVSWGGKHTGRLGPPEFEIVGIAGDVHHGGLHLPVEPTLFLSHRQEPNFVSALVIRTAGDPLTLAAAVRAEIRAVDPEQGVSHVQTLDALVADAVARPRLQTALLGAFALLALVMACVGLYGVLAYAVEQRRREMGVRLAIGATPGAIRRLIVFEGLRLTAIGLVLGLVGALAVTRQLEALLYDVRPADPLVFAGVAALLLAVATAACLVPARRAMRLDPASVLRDE